MDPNAIVVGAAPVTDPTTMEVFSSNTTSGPSEYLLNSSGNPISPVSAGVTLTAVDGNGIADTTGIGSNFYGTSAATPAAAAVGALVLQANTSLNPDDIEDLLDDSATVIGSAAASGAGLINADLAVGYAETATITATASNDVLYGTHLGDTFVGGPGSHYFIGTGGTNTLSYAAAPGPVTVSLSTDTVSSGYGGIDSFLGIQVFKGAANYADTFVGGGGNHTFIGGGGLNTLDYSQEPGAVNVNFSTGTATNGAGGTDTFSYIQKSRNPQPRRQRGDDRRRAQPECLRQQRHPGLRQRQHRDGHG